MVSELLQQAINALQINDVFLRSSQATCADDFRPKYADFSALHLQQMHVVKQTALFEVKGDGKLFHVHILLGTRWVQQTPQSTEPEVAALVEAEYVCEYRLHTDVAQEALDEFANQNASYHVWPYWREFLASQCERMRLPRLVMPTRQLPHHLDTAQGAES